MFRLDLPGLRCTILPEEMKIRLCPSDYYVLDAAPVSFLMCVSDCVYQKAIILSARQTARVPPST